MNETKMKLLKNQLHREAVSRYVHAYKRNHVDRFKSSLIEKQIRRHYSVSDELAILRQKDTKPDEYDTYFALVEQIKSQVSEEITDLHKDAVKWHLI